VAAPDPPESLAEVWRRLIVGADKSWVVFAHGTCVVLTSPTDGDLAAQAVDILREWGPVHAGSAAGDFGTITLDPPPGWVVTGHHPDVLTYVAPDDVPPSPRDLVIGLAGRHKRKLDATELQVIHVEDRRRG
jgi:hypothetical protein